MANVTGQSPSGQRQCRAACQSCGVKVCWVMLLQAPCVPVCNITQVSAVDYRRLQACSVVLSKRSSALCCAGAQFSTAMYTLAQPLRKPCINLWRCSLCVFLGCLGEHALCMVAVTGVPAGFAGSRCSQLLLAVASGRRAHSVSQRCCQTTGMLCRHEWNTPQGRAPSTDTHAKGPAIM